MGPTRDNFGLQENSFTFQTNDTDMQVEEGNPQATLNIGLQEIQINDTDMEVEKPQAARIHTSSDEVLKKRKPTEFETPSSIKNRRITRPNNKRKQASLSTSLDRSPDGVLKKKIKIDWIGPNLFKGLESTKTHELEIQICNHINFAHIHNTVKELTQKAFEYPQASGQASLFFQLYYNAENEALDNLRLKLVEPPQDPRLVIPLGRDEENQIEKLLFENFKAILNEVRKQGYWVLPLQLKPLILPSFHKICGCLQTSAEKKIEVEQSKALFSADEDLLERFCHLKIKEIGSFLKKGGKPPCSSIWLSILREQETVVEVTEVELYFEDGLAIMPLLPCKNKHPSLLEALFSSSWMDRESERTIIRFADHHLEDNLAVKKYCKEIEYGLLSSQIRPRETGKLNFWEDLAFNWKRRAKNDFSQIETARNTLKENRSSAQIVLDPEIHQLATPREGINQIDYVHFIMRNQRSGIGTLLNLPTGFGKTFIIFMAAAQQIKSIGKEKKKPYLVVVPAVNVKQSWIDNHKLLPDGLGIFSEKNSLFDVTASKDFFAKYKNKSEFKNYDFVVMTIDLLGNIVNEILSVSLPDLSKTDTYLLRCLGILSQDKFILGNPSVWKNRINELISFDYQTKVLKPLQALMQNEADFQDIFYPTDRKNILDASKLDKNHKDFITNFEKNCKQRPNIEDSFPEDFLRKISVYNEEGERCIESNKLFDYCHCFFYFAQFEKDGKALLQELWNRLFPILSNLSTEQKNLLEKYDAFKNCFNGLILDESEQILVSDGSSERTDILLDIAKTFQTRSKKDNLHNPLLVASSATPWHNEMGQLKFHLKILLPKLIGQFRDLHDDLFGKWNSFEASFDRVNPLNSSMATADQTDEKKTKKPRKSTLVESLNIVQTHFHQWVRLLFEETVSHEKPIAGQTNNSTEEVLYVSCGAPFDVPKGVEGHLGTITKFYSGLLQKEPSLNILQQIFATLNKRDHFAFYAHLRDDAAFLAMQISDYYQENFDEAVQIGLFYEDGFVNKPKGVKPVYENITFNTDRLVNINAFNNIFKFEDFRKYINQYFGRLEINQTKNKNAIAPLVSAIQSMENNELVKIIGKIDTTNPLVKMRKLLIEKNIKKLDEKEHQLYEIFRLLIALEMKSKAQVIMDFSQELEIFKPFIGKKFQTMETAEAFKTYSVEAMNKIRERIKKKKAGDLIKDLKIAIFHYLNKINQSKILIFGEAGSSGMRIDADHMTLLTGAWTEGKLNQIKGRVGRQKGTENRPCRIYLPITSTLYEFFILRYYIKKALIDQFITSKECIGAKVLCQHLALSSALSAHYKSYNVKEEERASCLDPNIHKIIKERTSLSQEYLTLGAYEKAHTIIPQQVRTDLHNFVEEILANSKLQCIQPPQNVDMILDAPETGAAENSEDDPAGKLEMLIEKVEAIKSTDKPKHPPRIKPAVDAAWSVDELERLKRRVLQSNKNKVIIFLIPTRGEHPDIPLQEFNRYISESVEADCFPVVIYGVNHKEGLARTIEKSLPELSNLFAKISAFTWFEEDCFGKVPPIGQMRNFCLEQARSAWQALTEGDHPTRQKEAIYLVSMDGDTQLTPQSFQRIMKKVDHKNSPAYVVATAGYDFAPEAPDWSRRSNRISMAVNHYCRTAEGPLSTYYGYLAEPLAGLSPSLLQKLFEQERKSSFFQMENKKMAPFGFWNFEGRRLQRYLNQLVDGTLNSYGPSKKNQKMPILKNYDRFIIEAPPFPLKPQPISKEHLTVVITRLFRQSQHSIQPRLMSSNIAYRHRQKSAPVLRFASYFYAKNVVNFLSLGPYRACLLTIKISDFYRKGQFVYSDEDCRKFGVSEEVFSSFLKKNFGEGQADPAHAEPSQKALEDFKKYAILLAFWARTVFHVLGEEFGATYSGEIDSKGRYTPMAMPENYPHEAESSLLEDEKLLQNDAIDIDEQPPEKPLMPPFEPITLTDIERNLAKKHRLMPIDMQDPTCQEIVKCYPQIRKVVLLAKHSLIVLFLQQTSADLNEQQKVCQATLEKVKEIYDSQQELAICLDHSGNRNVVRFAHLMGKSSHYSDRFDNGNGLTLEEEDLKTPAETTLQKSVLKGGPIGFTNLGNSCYINATLQMLFNIPEIRNLIAQKLKSYPVHAKSKSKHFIEALNNSMGLDNTLNSSQILTRFLHELFANAGPGQLTANLAHTEEHPIFAQHDPDEALDIIIGMLEWYPIQVAEYYFSPTLPEKGCRQDNGSPTPDYKFSIQLGEGLAPIDFQTIISQYFQKEQLPHEAKVQIDGKDVMGLEKTFRITNSPTHLFIHLKRFEAAHEGQLKKINRPVIFPGNKRILIPREDQQVAYEIIGYINHLGKTMTSGHYTAHVKNYRDPEVEQRWILCNDEDVKESDPPNVSSDVYIVVLKCLENKNGGTFF